MFRIVRLEMFLVILFIVITFPKIAVRTENTTVSTTDSTNASTTENTTVLTTDNISVSTTENTTVPKTDNSSVSTTKNTNVPTTDNISVSTTENITVQTTDNSSVSTAEKITQPTTDNSSVSTTENTIVLTTDNSSVSTTEIITVPTADNNSVSTTENTTVTTIDNISVSTTENITVPTTDNSSVSTTESITLPTTDNSSVSTTENTIVPTTDNSSVSTTEIITVPTTDNSSVSTTEKITLPTTDNSSVSTTENTAVPTTDNSSVSTTESTTVPTTYPSPPGLPANVSVVGVTNSSTEISWTAPENVGGGITSYVIRYMSIVEDNNDTRHCNNTIIRAEHMDTTQNNVTTIILENLQAWTLHHINVSANSSYGEGPAAVKTSRTNESDPGKPGFVHATSSSESVILVEWDQPCPVYGEIVNYDIKYTSINMEDDQHLYEGCSVNQTSDKIQGMDSNITNFNLTDLVYWTSYNICVSAFTTIGQGEEICTIGKTEEYLPGAINNLTVANVTSRSVQICWKEPCPPNGNITAYVVNVYLSDEAQRNTTETKELCQVFEKLLPCKNYSFNVTAKTKVGEGVSQSISVQTHTDAREEKEPTQNLSVIIGSVAGSALAFIIIGIVSIYIWRRQLACFMKRKTNVEDGEDNVTFVTENLEDKRKKRPIRLSDFHAHFETLSEKSNLLFSQAYKELNAFSPKFSRSDAELEETTMKNRYTNILPFNKTRVKIVGADDEPGSDYINANYVAGFSSGREYIATQGPIPSTINDFWRMIWEQNASIIVMLTQCIERGRTKCEQYWPNDINESVFYGDIVVHMESESHLPDFILRIFVLRLGDIERRVRHYYYLIWPDVGVPDSTDYMLRFVDTVRWDIRSDMIGPIVVHCSAGVGRTGTYIMLDTIIKKIQSGEDSVDIFGDVLNLRNCRSNMVQTEVQFVYIHECIRDYLMPVA